MIEWKFDERIKEWKSELKNKVMREWKFEQKNKRNKEVN